MAALVGYGRWGRNIARNLMEMGVLHTICDEQVVDVPDVHVTTDFSSLLTDGAIKQIFIATPPHTHFGLARQALLAGKDVFVEKPLCMDLEEARALVALAEAQGRILMVGHILNYHPCIRKIKELVEEGVIGDLRSITSNRLFPGFIREENVLWDLLPHDLSIILSLCQRKVLSVHCQGAVNDVYRTMDTATVALQFEGELAVQINVSWVYPYKEQKLTLIGTRGALVFDDTKPWPEKVALYTLSYQPPFQKVIYEQVAVEVESREPLRSECSHFLHCSATRQRPITDGEEGLLVMQVLHDIEQSIVVQNIC